MARAGESGGEEYRYPFGPYPTGWYLALESRELAPGAVRPLRLFGRDLVAFRTAGGSAVVADAHCPHMGAHLGYGGRVEGEGIRCPFHAWRFASDGRCSDVPYDRGRPLPRVGLACWSVHETSGVVLVHYSESGAAPKELCENVPDTAHFAVVHEVPGTPVAEVETEGHVYRQRSLVAETGETFTTQEAHGLGLVWLRSVGRLVFLSATTPLDAQHCELRLLFLVKEPDGARELSDGSRELVRSIVENTARDVPIWEHKVYREHPALVPGDGPIALLRRWARQFHEPPRGGSSAHEGA